MCMQCDLGCQEDTVHMVMQCPSHIELRRSVCKQIEMLNYEIDQSEYFSTI